MKTVTKGQMRVIRAGDIQRVGLRDAGRVPVGRQEADQNDLTGWDGDFTDVYGSVVRRKVATCNGPLKRSSSSTASGSRCGSERSRANCSG